MTIFDAARRRRARRRFHIAFALLMRASAAVAVQARHSRHAANSVIDMEPSAALAYFFRA